MKLHKIGDAFGETLLEQYRNPKKNINDITERDDGYIYVTPALRYFSKFKSWPPAKKLALKQLSGKILDVACGAGRNALYLQEKGFNVLGIDNSPGCIKICRLKGLKQAKILDLENIGTLPKKSFNTVLFMDNDFGLVCTGVKMKRILKKIDKILAKNGSIVAQSLEPYLSKNPDQLAYHKLNMARHRMPGLYTLRVRYKNLYGPWFDYLFSSAKDIALALQGTGFKINRVITPTKRDYILIIKRISECDKNSIKKTLALNNKYCI